jgi:hypothetical protein
MIFNPGAVEFAGSVLGAVESAAINRRAEKVVVGFGDGGPHPAFADVPERRSGVVLRQRLTTSTAEAPGLGTMGDLKMSATASGADASAWSVVCRCVLVRVDHEVGSGRGGGGTGGAVRVMEFVCVSVDGAADPVTVTPV